MKTEIESATEVAQTVASIIIDGSNILTNVYFVRHAQPLHSFADDRTRPLTDEGYSDAKVVLDFLMDKNIDAFYSSPHKRSVDTITSAADFLGKNIITDERLRERESGQYRLLLSKNIRQTTDMQLRQTVLILPAVV